MVPSRDCVVLIAQYEGCKLVAYLCPAGIPTIGYGATWHIDANRKVALGDKITQRQADKWLNMTIAKVAGEVENLAKVLTQGQLDALVSFTFNLGSTYLANSTLLELHRKGLYAQASEEFKKWNKARVGGVLKVLPGLTARRNAERLLYIKQVP